MAYWIFTTKISDEEFDKILKSQIWPIKETSNYRKFLEKNDKVVFYRGRPHGMNFVGTCVLDSKPIKIAEKKYKLKFSKVILWKKPVPIIDRLDDIKFIKTRKNWQIYLMGGIVRLPQEDFKTIRSFNK